MLHGILSPAFPASQQLCPMHFSGSSVDSEWLQLPCSAGFRFHLSYLAGLGLQIWLHLNGSTYSLYEGAQLPLPYTEGNLRALNLP